MDRLFVYGSLQPGGPNQHVLGDVEGEWLRAAMKGKLIDGGWGAGVGYPGLVIDCDGDDVHGYVFTSAKLDALWSELDEFEGEDYERTVASAKLADGKPVSVYVYALRASRLANSRG